MKTPQRIAVALCSLPEKTLMDPIVQTDTLQLQSLPVLVKAFHDQFDNFVSAFPTCCKSRALSSISANEQSNHQPRSQSHCTETNTRVQSKDIDRSRGAQ